MDGSIEITARSADVKHLAASEVGIPWSNSPVFGRQLARVAATEEQRALARSVHQDGYLVLEAWIPWVEVYGPEEEEELEGQTVGGPTGQNDGGGATAPPAEGR